LKDRPDEHSQECALEWAGNMKVLMAEIDTSTRSDDPADHAQRMMTVDQLADVWQVSPRMIRRTISKNQIPVIRLGRAVRISPAVAKLG
jgi:excisionase family DNA binding protein